MRSGAASTEEQVTVGDTYYPGTYGKWKIEPKDKLEVISYRIGTFNI